MDTTKKLNVAQVALTALWHVARLRYRILLAMLLPACTLLAMIALFRIHSFQTWTVGSFAIWIIRGVALGLAAVSCHRLIILGPGSVDTFGASGRHLREWKFLGWAAAIGLSVMVAWYVTFVGVSIVPINLWTDTFSTPNSLAFRALMSLAWLAAMYWFARLSCTLPATAIDHDLSPRAAYHLSAGNGWRLTLLVGGIPWGLRWIEYWIANVFPYEVATIVHTLVYMALLPFEIALLSVAYRELVRAQSRRLAR